jgi:hypothetical protein
MNFLELLAQAAKGHMNEEKLMGAHGILTDIFQKSGFAETAYEFVGGSRAVTGAEMLNNVSGIQFPAPGQMASVAGYVQDATSEVPAKTMLLDNLLIGQLSQNEIATTMFHEVAHGGSELSGAGANAAAKIQAGDARFLGMEEGRADALVNRVFGDANRAAGISAYETLEGQVKTVLKNGGALDAVSAEQALNQSMEGLRAQGIDPNLRPGFAGYIGISQQQVGQGRTRGIKSTSNQRKYEGDARRV